MVTNRIKLFPEREVMYKQQKRMEIQPRAAPRPGTPVRKKIRGEEVMLGEGDIITMEEQWGCNKMS